MSAQLGDAQLVELRPILHRFFAAGQRLGDGFKGHALFCQRVQLLKLFAGPRLPVSRSEEHTSELQSLMRISYAVFCLQKKTTITHTPHIHRVLTESTHYANTYPQATTR